MMARRVATGDPTASGIHIELDNGSVKIGSRSINRDKMDRLTVFQNVAEPIANQLKISWWYFAIYVRWLLVRI